MKALVLGVGMQGKAVIRDLSQSDLIDEIIAADVFPAITEDTILCPGRIAESDDALPIPRCCTMNDLGRPITRHDEQTGYRGRIVSRRKTA